MMTVSIPQRTHHYLLHIHQGSPATTTTSATADEVASSIKLCWRFVDSNFLAASLNTFSTAHHLWQKLRHARPSALNLLRHATAFKHCGYNWGRLKLHVNVYVAYCGHFQLDPQNFFPAGLGREIVFSGCQFGSSPIEDVVSKSESEFMSLQKLQRESENFGVREVKGKVRIFFSLEVITHATKPSQQVLGVTPPRVEANITHQVRDSPLHKEVQTFTVWEDRNQDNCCFLGDFIS